MKTGRLEVLIWVLVYGGLIVMAWGVSVQRTDDGLGVGLLVGGGLVAALGFFLIYVRSRMKKPS